MDEVILKVGKVFRLKRGGETFAPYKNYRVSKDIFQEVKNELGNEFIKVFAPGELGAGAEISGWEAETASDKALKRIQGAERDGILKVLDEFLVLQRLDAIEAKLKIKK